MAKKNKDKGPDPQEQLINLQAQQLAAQVANWAAQLDFQKARFNMLELPQWQQASALDVDKFAWEKSQDTWENAYKEALVTGMYQGKPTLEWLTQQAQLTGVFNGQETLQGKLTNAQIGQMNQQMKLANDEFLVNTTGYYNGQKTFDREKWESSQAQSKWQFLSTLSGPQNAFKQARAIATMPGGMSDMMDWLSGANGAMPGMTAVGSGGASPYDMLLGAGGNAAGFGGSFGGGGAGGGGGGAYTPAAPQQYSGQSAAYGLMGVPPPTAPAPPLTPANPSTWLNAQGMMEGVAPSAPTWPINPADAGMIGGAPPVAPTWDSATAGMDAAFAQPAAVPVAAGTTAPPYTYSPAGVQAPVDAWNYSPTPMGSTQVYPPGVVSPAQTPDVSTTVPTQWGDMVSGPPPTPPTTPLIPHNVESEVRLGGRGGYSTLQPNQINAANYNNMYQYQKELLWAGYEDAGWDKNLAKEAYERSLPKYTGPKAGKVAAW